MPEIPKRPIGRSGHGAGPSLPPGARRVLVIGAGGAGKSTLAAAMAERTALPLIHLDALYWRPGWVPTPDDEWDAVVAGLAAREAWVMDGNYSRTLEPRLRASDAVVLLDLPRRVCLWRLVRRRLQFHRRPRPDMAAGCRERLTWEFVWWVWTYRRRRRPRVLARLAAAAREGTDVVVLRSAAEVDRFLASLTTPAAPPPPPASAPAAGGAPAPPAAAARRRRRARGR